MKGECKGTGRGNTRVSSRTTRGSDDIEEPCSPAVNRSICTSAAARANTLPFTRGRRIPQGAPPPMSCPRSPSPRPLPRPPYRPTRPPRQAAETPAPRATAHPHAAPPRPLTAHSNSNRGKTSSAASSFQVAAGVAFNGVNGHTTLGGSRFAAGARPPARGLRVGAFFGRRLCGERVELRPPPTSVNELRHRVVAVALEKAIGRAWLVETEAAATIAPIAALADPLAVDQKARRAWRRKIDERCEGLHHKRGAHH
mmetsp:Transcript_24485/g.49690  ORF Transcript_24485/g.49690 Transcript_24485/m.49690 type:complete len:255 (+) Transcript_24485:152-916(+)